MRSFTRWRTMLVITSIVACCAALVAVAGASRNRASSTSIHLYAPFNGGTLATGIRVAKSVSGYCWTSSLADARTDAWRCFVGNLIYDPCFSNTTGFSSYVVCPLYTRSRKCSEST